MTDIKNLRSGFNLFLFDSLNFGIEELKLSNKVFDLVEVVLNEN